MTERLVWTPENPEEEPSVRLAIDGGRIYELDRTNTSLYRFMGNLAIYNHVFYAQIEENEVQDSFYMFNTTPAYPQLEKYMVENDFTVRNNLTEVSSADQEAYIRSAIQDLGAADTIPDDWKQ